MHPEARQRLLAENEILAELEWLEPDPRRDIITTVRTGLPPVTWTPLYKPSRWRRLRWWIADRIEQLAERIR